MSVQEFFSSSSNCTYKISIQQLVSVQALAGLATVDVKPFQYNSLCRFKEEFIQEVAILGEFQYNSLCRFKLLNQALIESLTSISIQQLVSVQVYSEAVALLDWTFQYNSLCRFKENNNMSPFVL